MLDMDNTTHCELVNLAFEAPARYPLLPFSTAQMPKIELTFKAKSEIVVPCWHNLDFCHVESQ
jgi:hypothetical protein